MRIADRHQKADGIAFLCAAPLFELRVVQERDVKKGRLQSFRAVEDGNHAPPSSFDDGPDDLRLSGAAP
jgi:hypothetical protein